MTLLTPSRRRSTWHVDSSPTFDLSPAITFLRQNQFLRVYYLTYFERHNCSSESAEFNVSETIEKYEDLM